MLERAGFMQYAAVLRQYALEKINGAMYLDEQCDLSVCDILNRCALMFQRDYMQTYAGAAIDEKKAKMIEVLRNYGIKTVK